MKTLELKEITITARNPVTGLIQIQKIEAYSEIYLSGTKAPSMFGEYQVNPGSKNKIHKINKFLQKNHGFWDLPKTTTIRGKVAHLVA